MNRMHSVAICDWEEEEEMDTDQFTCIIEFTTVIWSWEQRYQLSLGKEFISIFYNLMSSAYQIEIVFLKEFIYNLQNSQNKNWFSAIRSEGQLKVEMLPLHQM